MWKEIYDVKVSDEGFIRTKTGCEGIGQLTHKGYRILRVRVDGKLTMRGVHRLILLAFKPREDADQLEANHINSNREDNRLENLEWVTRAENIQHSYTHGNRDVTGTKNANCNTDEDTVKQICSLLQSGLKPFELRDKGFHYGLVRAIKSRRNWISISKDYTF